MRLVPMYAVVQPGIGLPNIGMPNLRTIMPQKYPATRLSFIKTAKTGSPRCVSTKKTATLRFEKPCGQEAPAYAAPIPVWLC